MTNKFNYKLYTNLSKLHQENLFKSLETFLQKQYTEDRVISLEDGFVYAIGNIPIMLVAHLDTVHKIAPINIYYDKEQEVIWSPEGIGADDRAGVYAIMELIKRGMRPHILFTCDEEVGGIGASFAADMLEPEVDFVIELDRRGSVDSVYYDLDNDVFEEYINQFGFTTAIGSFSDISLLCPKWGVAGVNLSIGYENEHTSKEILHVDWMMSTIDKVQKILYNKEYDKEKFNYVELEYLGSTSYYNWDKLNWGSYGTSTQHKSNSYKTSSWSRYGLDEFEDICDECGAIHIDTDLVPIGARNLCYVCYEAKYSYCNHCRTVYAKGTTCKCV